VVWIASLAGPLMLEREESDLRRVLASTTKPVLVYSYTTPGPASVAALTRLGLAWYPSPARAARAAVALVEAGPPGVPPAGVPSGCDAQTPPSFV
jgi:hypothetical protein